MLPSGKIQSGRGRPRAEVSPKTPLAKRLWEISNGEDFAAFAAKIGVARGETWAGYVRGERIPPSDILQKVVEVTGCDGHWLLTGIATEDRAPITPGLTEYQKILLEIYTEAIAERRDEIAKLQEVLTDILINPERARELYEATKTAGKAHMEGMTSAAAVKKAVKNILD